MQKLLIYTHRWLGAAGCLLFIVWFASGIVMMYARMPALAPEERLARGEPLDLAALAVTPADAVRAAGATPARLSLAMAAGRPVYRLAGGGARPGVTLVFADTGEVRAGVDREAARAEARRFAPAGYAGALHDDGLLTEPDQWTLQARAQLPIYRFALDDGARTRLYVSQQSGEVVLRTTSPERFWAYLGPVLHWIYITPLRRNGSLWSDVVIWAAIAGCIICVSGLVWGLMRFSPMRRFRMAGVPVRSPYAGMMKWHHYAGLIFGVITLTWTFSGLLSMGPWSWFSSPDLSQRQRALSASRPDYEGISLADVRAAAEAVTRDFVPRELELMHVNGDLYWHALEAPSPHDVGPWLRVSLGPRRPLPVLEHRFVDARDPARGTFQTFDESVLHTVANKAMGETPIADAIWLTEHDGYYYDARGQRRLPVLRIRYANDLRTWLYLDPARGGVVLANDRITRTGRWLYQGLHSLDFPALYSKRPLWDIVVIALSIGGLVVGVTVVTPTLRRWRNWWRRRAA